MKLLYIFIGGGAGSIARFLLGSWGNKLYDTLPLGTFVSNVIGCFILGFFINLSYKPGISNHISPLVVIGFCGGFTTFSTFSYENISLLKNGQISDFMIYTISSVLLGLLGIWGGMASSKFINEFLS